MQRARIPKEKEKRKRVNTRFVFSLFFHRYDTIFFPFVRDSSRLARRTSDFRDAKRTRLIREWTTFLLCVSGHRILSLHNKETEIGCQPFVSLQAPRFYFFFLLFFLFFFFLIFIFLFVSPLSLHEHRHTIPRVGQQSILRKPATFEKKKKNNFRSRRTRTNGGSE